MTDRQFGEEGARLSYGSYLHLPELLDQQELQSDAHDELLFIVVHQVCELWFKQCLHELDFARDAMLAGQVHEPRKALQRVHSIEQILIEQVVVLETMTPQDFLAFRALLAPASGFQSVQFRELEFLSGARDPAYVERLRQASPQEREQMQARLAEPSLWDAFLVLLGGRGFAVDDAEARRASLLTIAREREHAELWELSEALVSHDALATQWRTRHVDMVERQIGTKPGTGGSSGGEYLRSRLALRYFPELWELRSYL
ncbi:MAG: tryptophan 2,3-dioxygenase [Frankiaceae bacterium]|nr:tryptophan 2,3-dioxygenase [Frankiaceae bacterium]